MKIMKEGKFPKAKSKIKSPKTNRGTLTVTLLNLLNIKETKVGELLLTAYSPKYQGN